MEFAQIQETCQAEGYPPPKLTWIRLVSPLPVGRTEVKEGNLTIINLRPVDSGLYQCVARNSMGTKKATMNLFVQRGLYIVMAIDCMFVCPSFISANQENIVRKNDPYVYSINFRRFYTLTLSNESVELVCDICGTRARLHTLNGFFEIKLLSPPLPTLLFSKLGRNKL